MADNYLEKRMEDYLHQPSVKRRVATLRRLLRANRSYRGYDTTYRVRPDQLHRLMEVATLIPIGTQSAGAAYAPRARR